MQPFLSEVAPSKSTPDLKGMVFIYAGLHVIFFFFAWAPTKIHTRYFFNKREKKPVNSLFPASFLYFVNNSMGPPPPVCTHAPDPNPPSGALLHSLKKYIKFAEKCEIRAF